MPLTVAAFLALFAISVAATLPSRWFAEKENRRLEVEQPAPYARVPASAQPVDELITVGDLGDAATQYPPSGQFMMVTVMAPEQSLLSWLVDRVFLPYLGDVASYARATPETVAQRAAVRERGLDLLKKLSDDPEYDRIVLVGHSLGSIIAYDLLQLLWDERRPRDMTVANDGALMKTVREAGRFATLADGSSPWSPSTCSERAWS